MNRLRRLQLVAHGEPSDVIELSTVPEPAIGQEDVLVSMEAAPPNFETESQRQDSVQAWGQ
jgi:NADPH:quinone reductase-like Zn-dependent oxidoreductase